MQQLESETSFRRMKNRLVRKGGAVERLKRPSQPLAVARVLQLFVSKVFYERRTQDGKNRIRKANLKL